MCFTGSTCNNGDTEVSNQDMTGSNDFKLYEFEKRIRNWFSFKVASDCNGFRNHVVSASSIGNVESVWISVWMEVIDR